jgi:hypothetical protein
LDREIPSKLDFGDFDRADTSLLREEEGPERSLTNEPLPRQSTHRVRSNAREKLVSAIKLYEKLINYNDQSQLDLLKMRRAVRDLKAQLKSMEKLSEHREAALSVDP